MGEGTFPKVDGDVLFASETNTVMGLLGQIIQVDISRTNAVNKAYMQGQGWAICDGTTPASQGISDATITTTPDLREKFLRHSADETTGGTGGSATKDLTHSHTYSGGSRAVSNTDNNLYAQTNGGLSSSGLVDITIGTSGSATQDILPPYYDICYFIKVK